MLAAGAWGAYIAAQLPAIWPAYVVLVYADADRELGKERDDGAELSEP